LYLCYQYQFEENIYEIALNKTVVEIVQHKKYNHSENNALRCKWQQVYFRDICN